MKNIFSFQVTANYFRRSINSEKPFKGEVKNSCNEHSFQIILKNNLILPDKIPPKTDILHIVEGAIDACAIATLLKIKGKKDQTIKIITTAGNPHYSLKSRIEKINPDQIIIATDMDEQGRNFANLIAASIGKANCSAPSYHAKMKPGRRSLITRSGLPNTTYLTTKFVVS